jgi:protein-disulfide isomerase
MRLRTVSLAILLAAFGLAASIYLARAPGRQRTRQAVAVVAGQTIYEDDLLSLIQGQLRQLRNQEYELKSAALENLVNQKLQEAEAKKKGISIDKLMEQEVDAKVAEPSESELRAAYQGQKNTQNQSFAEVKAQLQQALKQEKIQEARQEYLNHLREQAEVSILLRPPRVAVTYDPPRLRGSPSAPVIIVEFADFQCPFCRQVEPTLKSLLAKYQGRLSFAYRDFPLADIHPQAESAAEACRCAGEQGKLWEYHDLLFADAPKLNRDGLLDRARVLKLDEKQFSACLSSGKYAAKIEEDRQRGINAGVNGTPGFFINGRFLSGAQPEAVFDRMIQAELAAPKDTRANP